MTAAEPLLLADGQITIHTGDNRLVLPTLADASFDSCVTDPPSGISFMGKVWDDFRGGSARDARAGFVAFMTEVFTEVYRVLKPGGYALVWALPRTSHWTTWALEDAGFEIRDGLAHMFGTGFPKSLDVSKAIDKAADLDRKVVSEGAPVKRMIPGADQNGTGSWIKDNGRVYVPTKTEAASPESAQWEGWGTALKPAWEHWILARKPLAGTVAANVLAHGVGGLNIDGCRVGTTKDAPASPRRADQKAAYGDLSNDPGTGSGWDQTIGRWPANLLLSHAEGCEVVGQRTVKGDPRGEPGGRRPGGFVGTGAETGDGTPNARVYGDETVEVWSCIPDCAVRLLDEQSGNRPGATSFSRPKSYAASSYQVGDAPLQPGYGDQGGASRFFYTTKAQSSDREDGLLGQVPCTVCFRTDSKTHKINDAPKATPCTRNIHPTVKSRGLMQWLCRLVTPPGGLILDPFFGSGSTGRAALVESFRCVGIEEDPAYVRIATGRVMADAQIRLF